MKLKSPESYVRYILKDNEEIFTEYTIISSKIKPYFVIDEYNYWENISYYQEYLLYMQYGTAIMIKNASQLKDEKRLIDKEEYAKLKSNMYKLTSSNI